MNFVDCKSFLESNSPDILAQCETNLDGSINSGNLFVRGYLPLIRKDSSTHMHGLTVYVKVGLPFARDLSLEKSVDLYSNGVTSLSVQGIIQEFNLGVSSHVSITSELFSWRVWGEWALQAPTVSPPYFAIYLF